MFQKIIFQFVFLNSIFLVFGQISINRKFAFLEDDYSDEEIVEKGTNYRLPNTTIPLHYDLYITTDIHRNETNYEGKVEILIEIIETTSEIVMHFEQTIENINLYDSEKNIIEENLDFIQEEENQFLTISTTKNLKKGDKIILIINFNGFLGNSLVGFYQTFYDDGNRKRIPIATTQFEATSARHAFPCFDEPWIRAKFSIFLRHGSNYTALSNMPHKSSEPDIEDSEYLVTSFYTTPPIPAYLIAFVISDYSYIEDKSYKIPLRVFSKKSEINHGQLALNVSGRILNELEKYFDVEYALPKMDQVEFPEFSSGAMENWGLVTYHSGYLLFNDKHGTIEEYQAVLSTISHEFVHQWTGNQVGPAWWSYLWLNEGFAAYYSYKILNDIFKNSGWLDYFQYYTVQDVMKIDVSSNMKLRPMTHYVEHPGKIRDLFDDFAYAKSGSVIQMFDHALGKDVWQKGMQKYMRMKSLSYATPNDLHMAMQEAINETKKPKYMKINVSKAMLSWETQPGYPIIHVSRKKSGILSFEQKQFIPDENETNEKIWQIPISYYSSKSPSFESTLPQIWMKTNIITPLISPMNESDWIIVNTQQTGYYRVSYDDHLWRNIMELLDKDPTKIHKFNRAQLIDDSFELAKLGQIPFENHLRVLEYLKHEDQYVPWLVANDSYEFILRNLRNNSLALESVSAQIRKNIKKFLARLKFYVIPNEPITDRLGRKLAIELACNHHSEICLLETRERLKNSIFKNEILEPELSNPVTCHGMRLADEDFFEVIVDIMLRETDNKERLRLLNGMSFVHNEKLFSAYQNLAIDKSNSLSPFEREFILLKKFKVSDFTEYHLANQIEFLRDNFEEINAIGEGVLSRFIQNLYSEKISSELEKIFSELVKMIKNEYSEIVIKRKFDNTDDNIIEDDISNEKLAVEFIEKYYMKSILRK